MDLDKLKEIKDGLCVIGLVLSSGFTRTMKERSVADITMHWFEWYNHTIYHNNGSPSTIIGNNVIYEFNGFPFTNTKAYCYVCGFDDETTMLWVIKYGDLLPLTIDKV